MNQRVTKSSCAKCPGQNHREITDERNPVVTLRAIVNPNLAYRVPGTGGAAIAWPRQYSRDFPDEDLRVRKLIASPFTALNVLFCVYLAIVIRCYPPSVLAYFPDLLVLTMIGVVLYFVLSIPLQARAQIPKRPSSIAP